MKSIKNIGLLIMAALFLMIAFSSCGSESPIPSDRHDRPVHGETHWNGG